jgi:hypothetical protein
MAGHTQFPRVGRCAIWSKNSSCRCPTHEPYFWRRFMINQAREILPLGQTVRILNICAEEPAVATTFQLPLSRNTSAGRPVAPDTAPLPQIFSVTIFEKVPILQLIEAFDSQSELLDDPNQLILFDL